LSISPPSSPQSTPSRPEIGGGSGAHKKDKNGGEGSLEKPKSKKRKSDVQDVVKDQDHHEEALVTSQKDKKDSADKKDKKENTEKKDKKDKKEKKEKKEKKDKPTPAQEDSVANDIGRAPVPPSNLASTSTTTPFETEGKKRKKEKKSKSTSLNEGESTPKPKKQKKSKPPLPIPISAPGPVPSNSTPGMGGPDELSSDEADTFEIDELLPSSPVLLSPPPPPPQNQNQIISQPTPTPKPRKKRVSDSSGFDTPSAPDHLRHPHSLSNTTGSGDTPSRLGRIGGTPIKKALVRLGASWVTSTPVPKSGT